MANPTNIVFITKDGGTVEVGVVGVVISGEHSAVELTSRGLEVIDSVIQQHTNPKDDLPFNILNSGFQVTPFIGIFGGPNPLGWGGRYNVNQPSTW